MNLRYGEPPDWRLRLSPTAMTTFHDVVLLMDPEKQLCPTHVRWQSFWDETSNLVVEGWYDPDADRAEAAQAIAPLVEAIEKARRRGR